MALPDGLSSCAMCVELSTDGTAWTDYSDWLSVLEPPELTRVTGEQPVFGEDTMVTTVGKRNPAEVRIRGIYTDTTVVASSPFELLWDQYEVTCGGAACVRWGPAGCTTDDQVFTTATGATHDSELISITPPGGDAADGAPLMWEAVIRTSQLHKGVWS
jgi:hypothetical protein